MRTPTIDAELMVEDTQRFIQEHYTEDIHIQDIVEAVGETITTRYFNSIFKKHTGESIQEYIMRQRILVAAELLRTTKKTVMDIAGEVNACAPWHLAKLFRRYMGCSPSEYRKKAGRAALPSDTKGCWDISTIREGRRQDTRHTLG